MRFRAPLLSVAFLISFLLVQANAQSNSVVLIRDAIDAHEWVRARAELEKLRINEPEAFLSREYDYLLGRASEQSGAISIATRNYQENVARGSLLSGYALWHLARLARSSDDLILEREHLRKLLMLAPDSLLYDSAGLRLVESFLESGDQSGAIDAVSFLGGSKKVGVVREASLLLGQAYEQDGKLIEARDVYSKLVMQMPDASRPDDFALAAVRRLDELAQRGELPVVSLTEADYLMRASIYQFNRDFAGARKHYLAVIEKNPQSGTIPNALYQVGRGLYLENKYAEAIKTFQKVVDDYPQSQSARDALGGLAPSYLRLKRVDDGISTYKLLIARFPDAPNPERPYLNIIDALHEARRYPEALNWVQQTRARFKNDLGDSLALFAQLRIHLAQNAWSDVVRDADELGKFSDLGGARVPGGTTATEVLFLKGLALEQLGRAQEAITAYLSIPAGRNEYYGFRATQRLLSMSANQKTAYVVLDRFRPLVEKARSADAQRLFEQARIAARDALRLNEDRAVRRELHEILKRAYAELPKYELRDFRIVPLLPETTTTQTKATAPDPHEQRGKVLYEMALYDEAIPEILAARALKPSSSSSTTQTSIADQIGSLTDENYTIALYSLRAHLPNRSVRFGEQFWKTVPADYDLELAPPDLVELLYPVPFRGSLMQHASTRKLDPRFVLSIIRQESRYQVDVKSVAAARGMMQFIPSTANEIAAQLNLKNFTQDDLYFADTAILFGSQYLANLFQQFPNQLQAVAGSYNGGSDNLARWIARSRSEEPDRYVPEVGFAQTKDYIYKVMTNYWNYQHFYDNELKPLEK